MAPADPCKEFASLLLASAFILLTANLLAPVVSASFKASSSVIF